MIPNFIYIKCSNITLFHFRDYMKNSVWNLSNTKEQYSKAQANNNPFLYSELSCNNKQNKETKIHMGHWTMWGEDTE